MGNTFYEDVIIGIIAAIVLSAFTSCLALCRALIVRRRYPIAGRYASEYEDHIDGELVINKAITDFHQRGRRVWGTANNIADGRRWRLEGQVGRGGRLFGTYDSPNPHDEGLGGFYLELRSDGKLEGMWSGYDSVNRSVEAGRYRFWPLERIDVRPMQPRDISLARAILGEALGHRYITADGLSKFDGRDPDMFASVASSSDGTILGAATGQVVDFQDFERSMPVGSVKTLASAIPELEFHRIGILKSVAVTPAARGCGAATNLVTSITRRLWENEATCVISIGWKDIDGCHIQGVLEGLGYRQVTMVDDFWRRDSEVNGYSCPSCGNPCRCSAVIFMITRSNTSAALASAESSRT